MLSWCKLSLFIFSSISDVIQILPSNLTIIKNSKRPINFTFAYPNSKALSKADVKYGKRSSKITTKLRKEIDDAKRNEYQEDLLSGKANWESFVWLGFDSYKHKSYEHAVEYLLYGLKKNNAMTV